MATTEIGPPTAATQILVASEPSEFKETVVQRLTAELEPQGFFIKVTDLANLEEEPLEKYNAIVLLNALEMMTLDGDVDDVLDSANESLWDKTILVTTTSHEDWSFFHEEPQRLGVDAITAASNEGNVDAVVAELLANLQATFSAQTPQ